MGRPLEVGDLFALRWVAELDARPGCAEVAFTLAWADLETDENRSQLWARDDDGLRRLTDGHRDDSPRWSPSGERLAFLRAQPGGVAQPALRSGDGGEVRLIEGFAEDGAVQLEWLDDERLLVVAPRRPPDQVDVDDEELARRPRSIRRLDYRFNERGWIHDRPRQVLIVDLATGEQRPIGLPRVDHGHISPAPNGREVLAVASSDPDADLTGCTHVWLLHGDGAAPRRLTPPGGTWGQVGWTADARPIAVGDPDAGRVGFARPHLLGTTEDPSVQVVGPHDVNALRLVGSPGPVVSIDDAVLLPGVRRGSITIDRYDVHDGSLVTLAGEGAAVDSYCISGDGTRLFAAVAHPTRPSELAELVDGTWHRLSSFNDELLDEIDLVEPEIVTVDSTGGAGVEAFVYVPPASAPTLQGAAARRPALLYIHGGPMAAYGNRFFDEFQLAAALGYVVMGGNPRGSDGYGEAWARSITGRLGTVDWDDVRAMADALCQRHDVDPARVGIGGGSYGGFMTAWAIAHTDRFAAALVERAVTNWVSFEGTSDIGWFARRLADASGSGPDPGHGPAALRRQSPLTYASTVTTPTMILHSEEDWRCPVEQAEQLFAAYRRHGVDVTMVRFPAENHELTRSGGPRHRRERFRLVHDFYADHLDGGRVSDTADPEPR